MVVDAEGCILTQRECPRMALVQPRITSGALELRGPEVEPLVVPLQAQGPLRRRAGVG